MAVQAVCPNCGADVVFTTGAPLRVCDHCRAVIARRDRDLENLGQVVDLVDTHSPLALYRDGLYRGAKFTLVGRAQLLHPRGGVWDEWYAAFTDGRWGWLAEAQGRFYMTFPVDELGAGAPAWESLEPGEDIDGLPPGRYKVAERAEASFASAAGEIPYRFRPKERFRFADLSGPEGAFATVDYGSPGADPGAVPTVYVGREVTLAELGWDGLAGEERAATLVKADRMACPACDGSLELVAPDQAKRVICKYCGATSDVTGGKLEKLELLKAPLLRPLLPLGGKGTLMGREWRVCGFMRRFTIVEGVEYDWDEYLLHNAKDGLRWLVEANGHWSFVEPVATGDVHTEGRRARHPRVGDAKLFQQGMVYVRAAVGEFTWKIEPLEKTWSQDFIRPPYMLSVEKDDAEVNCSLGTYLPGAQVAKAFGVTLTALPRGVAPNQPHDYDAVLKLWGIVLAAIVVLAIAILATRGTREVVSITTFEFSPDAVAPWVWYSEPFELRGRRNVEIELWAGVDNSWVYVEGDLVDEATGLVQPFEVSIEQYSGVEGGEAWSEGSLTSKAYVSALPPGWYSLRLEVQSSLAPPPHMAVTVRQGVPRFLHLGLLLLGVSIIPGFVLVLRLTFEKRRWEESNLS